jgi:hypothetical protein
VMDGDNIDVCICLFYGGEWEFEGVMDDFNRGLLRVPLAIRVLGFYE